MTVGFRAGQIPEFVSPAETRLVYAFGLDIGIKCIGWIELVNCAWEAWDDHGKLGRYETREQAKRAVMSAYRERRER